MDGSARPHSADERFTLFANDRQILQYYFNDEVTLDYANDHFLSELFFAIREHTNIYSCSMDEEKRTNLLLQTMSKCSIKIRETFMAVLKELSMEHVASLMSWWEDEAVPMDATTSTCMYN